MTEPYGIMIVAGEASGDAHAAKVVSALREIRPEIDFEFFGAAGPKMRSAGVEATVSADDLSIVGLVEIASALPIFLRASARLKAVAAERRPKAVVLVDFPDFNLKLAKALKKSGFPIIYYISPQLWAWRKYRISAVKKYIDLMLTILPFEKGWYERRGVKNVEYVGSPLAREVHVSKSKSDFCLELGLDPTQQIVSLLPGSRNKEIVRILPVMLDTAVRLDERRPDTQFLLPVSATTRAVVDKCLSEFGNAEKALRLTVIEGRTYDALGASDAAAITSGTATLEAAIIGTPMAVVYKTSALNYGLFEPFIDVPHYGLVNLIAEERVAAELIQSQFTSEALANEIERLLRPDVNADMRKKLASVAAKLGTGGASRRVAEAIVKLAGVGEETTFDS